MINGDESDSNWEWPKLLLIVCRRSFAISSTRGSSSNRKQWQVQRDVLVCWTPWIHSRNLHVCWLSRRWSRLLSGSWKNTSFIYSEIFDLDLSNLTPLTVTSFSYDKFTLDTCNWSSSLHSPSLIFSFSSISLSSHPLFLSRPHPSSPSSSHRLILFRTLRMNLLLNPDRRMLDRRRRRSLSHHSPGRFWRTASGTRRWWKVVLGRYYFLGNWMRWTQLAWCTYL